MAEVEEKGGRERGGNGGETGGRERVGESSQEPSREGREWRKSVVVSHVRSSDGDVLGIATRESERRRNLANPLEFSTPESHPPILRHIRSPTTAVEPLESRPARPRNILGTLPASLRRPNTCSLSIIKIY